MVNDIYVNVARGINWAMYRSVTRVSWYKSVKGVKTVPWDQVFGSDRFH